MKSTELARPIKTAYNILKVVFTVIPVVAGLDKFTNLLTRWETYLSPGFVQLLPFDAHTFMMVVGAIEIAAGIIVLIRPAIGGYIVAAWLSLIALTLLAGGHYLDVAVRDLVMATGAASLALLANAVSLQHSNFKTAAG